MYEADANIKIQKAAKCTDWEQKGFDAMLWNPRPEEHVDMIPFEVFLKNIHLIPQDERFQWHYL